MARGSGEPDGRRSSEQSHAGSENAPSGMALTWQTPRAGVKTTGSGSCAQRGLVPGDVERGGAGAAHGAFENAGELGEGTRGDVIAGVGARKRGLWNQHVVTVGVESRYEGDGHAGERVAHDERGRLWLEEMRRKDGADAGPIGVGRGVERAVAAD